LKKIGLVSVKEQFHQHTEGHYRIPRLKQENI